MRELTELDARNAVLGGGVLACGGGGWKHHGELMGRLATSLNRPILAQVDELPDDAWVATVTAIGAPASSTWEIRPIDYIHALQALLDAVDVPIAAVMTAQNGYSTTLNGWIQSSALGVKVLDAAGDIRAHPTGKLGSLGLGERPCYISTQVVSGGNRGLNGHFLSVNTGDVSTCDDVLRDISVRTGGFIAAARNPVELDWVRGNAALGAISLALDLGDDMAAAGAGTPGAGSAVIAAVCERLSGHVIDSGPLSHERALQTFGGWDRGALGINGYTVSYLNEYMAIDSADGRIATYPDVIAIIDQSTGEPVAVKDAVQGMDVALLVSEASKLPVSSSAIDPGALRECEEIMGINFLRHLDPALRGGTVRYGTS